MKPLIFNHALQGEGKLTTRRGHAMLSRCADLGENKAALGPDPMRVYLEVGPMMTNGIYSMVNVDRTAGLEPSPELTGSSRSRGTQMALQEPGS